MPRAVAQEVQDILGMAEDDEICFEGFGTGTSAARKKAAVFREREYRLTMQMFEAAGILPAGKLINAKRAPDRALFFAVALRGAVLEALAIAKAAAKKTCVS